MYSLEFINTFEFIYLQTENKIKMCLHNIM